MLRIILLLLFFLTAFTIGLSSVWLTDHLFAPVTEPVAIYEIASNRYALPRFAYGWRGCGEGYSQGYESDDDQRFVEGVVWKPSRKVVKRDFQDRLRESDRILQRIPNYRNHKGDVGERIIVEDMDTETGLHSVSILWYGGGDHYRFINAPTLDLVLEFERFLIDTNFPAL